MTLPTLQLPSFDNVADAAKRLKGIVQRTPVLRSSTADAQFNARFYFKCENLQRTGSFKFRGAFNTLSQFNEEQRRHGVLAFSAGNHAQAIALSARLLDIPATVLMPEDAPAAKMAATRAYGAQVVTFDRYAEDREAISRKLAQDRGLTLVPPFDHPDVIAGQGTAAMELFEDVPHLDLLFVCVGGGGLLAGSILAAQSLAPNCRLVGVEPEAGNDGQQSVKAGHIIHIPTPRTIADGAQSQALGQLTFPIIAKGVHAMVTATDLQLVDAVQFFAERMKIVVEPTGALSFAGAKHSGIDLHGAHVGILVSGGNLDMARLARFLAS